MARFETSKQSRLEVAQIAGEVRERDMAYDHPSAAASEKWHQVRNFSRQAFPRQVEKKHWMQVFICHSIIDSFEAQTIKPYLSYMHNG
jgi:hypothetical protein